MSKPIAIVKALLLNEQNEVTYFLELTRSLKKAFAPGQGDLPGGKVEEGESLLDAVTREIKEETGLTVYSLHHISSHNWTHEIQQYHEHLYYAFVDTQHIILSADEHERYQWTPLSHINESSLHPAIKKIIDTWIHANTFTVLCSLLNLGKLHANPIAVTGGLLHKMWHIKTESGEYAIKELNPRIMLQKDAVSYYELTEKIATQLHGQGIPTIKCIIHDDRSVIKVNDQFFIVYPWITGKVLPNEKIDEDKANIIGSIFAKIHALRLDVKELRNNQFIDLEANIDSKDYIASLYHAAEDQGINLKNSSEVLCVWYDKYANAVSALQNDLIISHGDCDQKNVLWKSDNTPVIIDWEGARYINPTQEIIGIALDWSGVQICNINFELVVSILDSYQASGGSVKKEIIEQSLWAFVGIWLNWLNFNIERIVKNYPTEEQVLAKKEIERTLNILYYLVDHLDQLQNKISNSIN